MKKTRYTYKYPRTKWDGLRDDVMHNRRAWWYSVDKAVAWVEECMRPGYTREPYMQLIRITDDCMEVVAEYEGINNTGWISTLVAAGFTSRRVL